MTTTIERVMSTATLILSHTTEQYSTVKANIKSGSARYLSIQSHFAQENRVSFLLPLHLPYEPEFGFSSILFSSSSQAKLQNASVSCTHAQVFWEPGRSD